MSVTIPLLSIKVLISTRVPAEEDPPPYKKGQNRTRLFVRERVELSIEPSMR